MAVNQFRQRLMAAGASPARATQMAGQKAFEAGAPATLGKPQGPNEWYNESYASASQSLYPSGFVPPTVDSPDFKVYYDVVYGKGAYDKFGKDAFTKALGKSAPLYNSALKSTNPLDQIVVKGLRDGKTLAELQELLLTKEVPGSSLTPQQMVDYASKLYTEYGNAQQAVSDIYEKQISKNRDYKYRLPDPKLRYGTTTNLSQGTVDILSNPTAAKAYAAYQKKTNDPTKLAQYKAFLVREATKRQLTPWKDEARRRDSLKGKKIGG